MSKINFKSLNKHMYDDNNHCVGFDIKIGKELFHITKFSDKPTEMKGPVWQIKSYYETNIPSIMFEMPKDDSALTLIAETALFHLANYLRERYAFEQELLNGINEYLVV